jgi:hypothetical protein
VVQSTLLKAGGQSPICKFYSHPVHPAQGRAQLHRASIVYEFEQYRQKTVGYRTKIWLAIWMQKPGFAFHGLAPRVRFSFDCNSIDHSATSSPLRASLAGGATPAARTVLA